MANNRMWLRCKFCDEIGLISKWYCDDWSVYDLDTLNRFLSKHSFCGGKQTDWGFGNQNMDVLFEEKDQGILAPIYIIRPKKITHIIWPAKIKFWKRMAIILKLKIREKRR